jgi:hypothetical protein
VNILRRYEKVLVEKPGNMKQCKNINSDKDLGEEGGIRKNYKNNPPRKSYT